MSITQYIDEVPEYSLQDMRLLCLFRDKQVNQTVFVRLRNKIAPNQCRLAFVKKLHWQTPCPFIYKFVGATFLTCRAKTNCLGLVVDHHNKVNIAIKQVT